MKVLLVGRYNSRENLLGPEKVAKRLFYELVKVNLSTCFVEYFFDGNKYNYMRKLLGNEVISEEPKIIRFGLIPFFIFLCKYRPEVIHIVKYERFQVLIFLYKLFFPVRLVYTVHGVIAHENINYKTNSITYFYLLKDKIVESLIYKYSSSLIFLSKRTINIAQKYFAFDESKIQIIPNGIDDVFLRNYHKLRSNELIKAVVVGNISRREKGIDILLEVLKKVDIKMELHVVSNEKFDVESLSSNVSIVRHSKFSTIEYASFLSDKDIYISSSKYEPFSISSAEGVASGLIPFFTVETGFSELISHTNCGFYFPFENLSRINEYLLSFSENREEYNVRKDELYETITQLTWLNITRRYMLVYK